MMIFFKIHVIIFWGDIMQALVCEISWKSFYRGEEEGIAGIYPVPFDGDKTNFINFNGYFYGAFDGTGLQEELKEHHQSVDYVIFIANHPTFGHKIVGWYCQATLYRDMQFYDVNQPYFVSAKDKGVVLLPENSRSFTLSIDGPYAWVEIDRRLMNFLKTTKRINYRQEDLNRSVTMPLQSLEITCGFIEKEIASANLLQALLIVNRAILSFGRLASLIYYKAWILYSFLQYRQASLLLFQIKELPDFHDFACYMLGNIYFETEDYETSLSLLESCKKINPDQTAYMIAQCYAMLNDVKKAKKAIDKAMMLNPDEEVYEAFANALREWSHE